MRHRKVDVLILGAGPAGSTAGALLARAGIEAVVVDAGLKASCEHTGELLVPGCMTVLDELGIREDVMAMPRSRPVTSLTLTSHDGDRSMQIHLGTGHGVPAGGALAVDRLALATTLRDHARRLGAELVSGRATGVSWDGQRLAGLTVVDPAGQEHALYCRVFLDASGSASFLASRMGWRFPYPKHRMAVVAVELGPAPAPDTNEGPAVVLTRGGWLWLLPLGDGSMSLGLVSDPSRKGDFSDGGDQALWRAVTAAPEAARRIAGRAPLGPASFLEDCAFRVLSIAGDGYCLLGDAQGFIEPFLTSGLLVALGLASAAAQDVIECLLERGKMAGHDFGPTMSLARSLRRTHLTTVRAFHDPHVMTLLLSLGEIGDFRHGLTAVLGGDLLRPGAFRRVLPLRVLSALGELQRLTCAVGLPLAPPLLERP